MDGLDNSAIVGTVTDIFLGEGFFLSFLERASLSQPHMAWQWHTPHTSARISNFAKQYSSFFFFFVRM